MAKELTICVIIIALIFIGDIITQNYTNDSINETLESLSKLREELFKEEINWDYLKQNINNIQGDWEKRHSKLAYYIEHDELEKVETDMSGLNGYIQVEEDKEAVSELDRTVYVLKHIQNKNVFNLENIF